MSDPAVSLEAKSTENAAFALQRRLVAEVATAENVPSGLLHRCAIHASRIRELTGNPGSPASSQGEWEDIYHELVFSRVHGMELLPLSDVQARGSSYLARGLTAIFIADFNYEIVRPRFWTAVQRYLATQMPPEQFPLEAHPIGQILECRRAFLATAVFETHYGLLTVLPRVHRGLEVSFVVPRAGFFSNHAIA